MSNNVIIKITIMYSMCTTSLLHTVETHAIGERTLTAYRLVVPSVAFATCQLYIYNPFQSIFYSMLLQKKIEA